MALILMHSSVPLRGRKGKTSDPHRQHHSLFDSGEKNVTRGSSHQSEAARESKRPSQSLSTECSTENLLIALVISHTQYKELLCQDPRARVRSEGSHEGPAKPFKEA